MIGSIENAIDGDYEFSIELVPSVETMFDVYEEMEK